MVEQGGCIKVFNSMLDSINVALKKGKRVTIAGFGAFKVTKRKARTGGNPKTGEAIKIPSVKVPKFSAGKPLKVSMK